MNSASPADVATGREARPVGPITNGRRVATACEKTVWNLRGSAMARPINVVRRLRLSGGVSEQRLRASLLKLVEEEESLRTAFVGRTAARNTPS